MANRVLRTTLWVLAAAAVVALPAVEILRPVAPTVDPVVARTFLDPAEIARALDYRMPLRAAALWSVALRMGSAVVIGMVVWVYAVRGQQGDGRPSRISVWTGVAGPVRAGLAGAAAWAFTDLIRLPLGIWVWSRAVEFGLSTQGIMGWSRDWAVQHVPYWIGAGLAVGAALWLRRRVGVAWIAIGGLLAGAVAVSLIVISPLVFEPLLFDFTPLPGGPLRDGITDLVAAAGDGQDAQILVADASRRTTASNAYVSGIAGTRRIVLYDTLINDAPTAEILVIVAHELGHDGNHDVERTAIALFGIGVLVAAAVELLLRAQRLRFRPGVPDQTSEVEGVSPAQAVMAVTMVIVLLALGGPLAQWSSRRAESAADARAIELTDDLAVYRRMMVGLARRNLSDPMPPPWIVDLFYSHPPIGERIARSTGSGSAGSGSTGSGSAGSDGN